MGNSLFANMADLFTAQQRQGGASYAHRTLVGNWSEDFEGHEVIGSPRVKPHRVSLSSSFITGKVQRLHAQKGREHIENHRGR